MKWGRNEMKKWNYVEKDGNPTKAGVYWVTLIYPEWKEGQKTGKYIAEVDTRYFADLKKEPDCKEWIMSGQPEGDFAWTEQTGSRGGEKVYAWKPMEDIGIADLPEGVTEA